MDRDEISISYKERSDLNKSAYIRLVKGSKQSEITLEEVKQLLNHYQEMTRNTGQQLSWDYQQASFPYEITEKEQEGVRYLVLKGQNPEENNYLMIGNGQEKESGIHYIQIVLPERGTHGDLAKANEFSKYLAKKLAGELHLLNGRIMYFNQRKG